MRTTVLVLTILLPGLLVAQSPTESIRAAYDPVRVDPAHYSVESETEGILALRLKLRPDEAARQMAYFQDALIVCLNECHVRLIIEQEIRSAKLLDSEISGKHKPPAREVKDIHMEAGTTRVIGGGMRSIANLSTKPVEMLFIERKTVATNSK